MYYFGMAYINNNLATIKHYSYVTLIAKECIEQ